MADEFGVIVSKRGGAKNVVGMDMGQDHIADRLIGAGAYCGAERDALYEAAAGIDDRDRVAADNKADIGDSVFVCGRRLLMHPLVNEYPCGDFRHRQRRRLGMSHGRRQNDGGQNPRGLHHQPN